MAPTERFQRIGSKIFKMHDAYWTNLEFSFLRPIGIAHMKSKCAKLQISSMKLYCTVPVFVSAVPHIGRPFRGSFVHVSERPKGGHGRVHGETQAEVHSHLNWIDSSRVRVHLDDSARFFCSVSHFKLFTETVSSIYTRQYEFAFSWVISRYVPLNPEFNISLWFSALIGRRLFKRFARTNYSGKLSKLELFVEIIFEL